MNYTVQITDMFAQLELSEFHDHLYKIFESLLNAVTKDIPAHDQVCFVLQSLQLEYPISLPFLHLENGIIICVNKRMITSRSIYVLIRVNYVSTK